MDLLKKVWPEWKIEGELGEGSFGKVYKIKREDIGGTYYAALKVIRIPKDKNEINAIMTEGMMDKASATHYFQGMVEEIVKEFAMMEKLKGNTNIVAYEDHKVIPHEDSLGWDILIRMELLTSLTDYMAEHTLGEQEAIKLGIDICRALELCQKYHIIHRDIKPENIFVSEMGDYKLGDFGVARTAEKTSSGMSKKGTYTYMAPEVYRGGAYNATVDLYSLGIVLYRLVNNYRTPFLPPAPQMISFSDKETAQSRRMSGEEFPAPTQGSEALTAVIRKACAYNPKERFADAAQMRRALEGLAVQGETPATAVADDGDRTVAMPVAEMAPVKQQVVKEDDRTVAMVASVASAQPVQATKLVSVVKKEITKQAAVSQETTKKKSLALFAGIGVAAVVLVVGGVVLVGGLGSSDELVQGSRESNVFQESSVGDSVADYAEDVMVAAPIDVALLDYNILASELVYDEEGYRAVAKGKEATPHDNSMYPPIGLLGTWVLEDWNPENLTHLAPGSQITIAEGTPRETQWESLPYKIHFHGYMDSVDLCNENYSMDIEEQHIDGMYSGQMLFMEFSSEPYAISEAWPDIVFDTHENILAVGIPYTQEHVGLLNCEAETTYIQEIQYEMEWVGWKLKLTCGDYSATYVPEGMQENAEYPFRINYVDCVANSEPFEGIQSISNWDFKNPEEKTELEFYSHKWYLDDATTEFREDGTVKIVTEGYESWDYYVPSQTYELQYLVSGESLILISEGKYHIYTDGGSWMDRYMAQFVQGDVNTADEDTVNELLDIRDGFIEELELAFDVYGIDVTVDEESGKVSLDSSILFAHDESELSQEGKAFLDNFVAAYWFAMGSCTEADYVSEILVEGHTDTNGSYDYNLVLSKERADSVANYCMTACDELGAGAADYFGEMLTSVGRSYDEPVYDADGTVNMDASRRVVFRFRLTL